MSDGHLSLGRYVLPFQSLSLNIKGQLMSRFEFFGVGLSKYFQYKHVGIHLDTVGWYTIFTSHSPFVSFLRMVVKKINKLGLYFVKYLLCYILLTGNAIHHSGSYSISLVFVTFCSFVKYFYSKYCYLCAIYSKSAVLRHVSSWTNVLCVLVTNHWFQVEPYEAPVVSIILYSDKICRDIMNMHTGLYVMHYLH